MLFSLALALKAQELELKKQKIIEDRIDFLVNKNQSGNADYTSLFEQLEFYYHQPIQLNSTTKDELSDLGLLSDIQINNLLEHIEKYGKLLLFEELQSVEAFDIHTIRQIHPFVIVGTDADQRQFNLSSILKESTSQLFLRYSRVLEKQKGFAAINESELKENPNSRYLGNADKIYTRYKLNYSNYISLGFTAEKDAGEEFFRGNNKKGFDFYSAHLFLRKIGHIKQLAIGDFQAQFGQGLTFGSGLGLGISNKVQSVRKNSPGLSPYTSVQEDQFLRGSGICIERKNWEITFFYSSKKVDANISESEENTDELIISSLPIHGYHRTKSEIENKNIVYDQHLGLHLAYGKRNYSVGLTAVQNKLKAKLENQSRSYKKFGHLSGHNSNVGLDYSYIYKNINFFGEFSHSINYGLAYINSALLILHPNLSLSIQNRNYQKDYRPIQSNANGENTDNSNEKGTFLGLNAKLNSKIFLSASVDHFSFPWLKFRTDAPSYGFRQLLQLNYEAGDDLSAYLRYKKRSKGENNSSISEGMNELSQEITQNYRLHLSYRAGGSLILKSRIEYMLYQKGENQREKGILLYQDIQFKKMNCPISLSVRYAIFDTDSYDSRIYAYENDVLYAFSIPAYSGKASRFYLLAKYHIHRGIDFWIRYAQTYYADREKIGSGKDQIAGNEKSEIKAMLRFKF